MRRGPEVTRSGFRDDWSTATNADFTSLVGIRARVLRMKFQSPNATLMVVLFFFFGDKAQGNPHRSNGCSDGTQAVQTLIAKLPLSLAEKTPNLSFYRRTANEKSSVKISVWHMSRGKMMGRWDTPQGVGKGHIAENQNYSRLRRLIELYCF